MSFSLTFAGVPFLVPGVLNLNTSYDQSCGEDISKYDDTVVYNPDTIKWVEENLDEIYAYGVMPLAPFYGKNIYQLALPNAQPVPRVGLGQWFYPTGASRWSVFYGLANSRMVNEMVKNALPNSGVVYQPFVLQADVDGATQYRKGRGISTNMRMLPPRPLGNPGKQDPTFSGLWLVTLVDERWDFQQRPCEMTRPNPSSVTWMSIITEVATSLGISLSIPTIPSTYGDGPEPDSQLWTNWENAALLLDALAENVGMRVVRKYAGTYELQDAQTAGAAVISNRGAKSVGMAGGDIIGNLDNLPGFNIIAPSNAAVPSSVLVSFPRFNTTAPAHYVNSRFTESPRPTAWIEDSYGDVYAVNTTLAEAGFLYHGATGTKKICHSTAKAFVSDDDQETPDNDAFLTALAKQVATDYYQWQIGTALDEKYMGIVPWEPEGFDDLLFTWRTHEISTRVFRRAWNWEVREYQHSSGGEEEGIGKTVALGIAEFSNVNWLDFPGAEISQVYDLKGVKGLQVLTRCCSISLTYTSNILDGIISLQDQYIGDNDKWFKGEAFGPAKSDGNPDKEKPYNVRREYIGPGGAPSTTNYEEGYSLTHYRENLESSSGIRTFVQALATVAYELMGTVVRGGLTGNIWGIPNIPAMCYAYIRGMFWAQNCFVVGGGSSGRLIISSPNAPTVEAGTSGVGNFPSTGNYTYKVTSTVPDGESADIGSGTTYNVSNTAQTVRISWLLPSQGQNQGTVISGYNVYRSGSDGQFLIARIAGASTLTYLDDGSTISVGSPPTASPEMGGAAGTTGDDSAFAGADGAASPGATVWYKGGLAVKISGGGGNNSISLP